LVEPALIPQVREKGLRPWGAIGVKSRRRWGTILGQSARVDFESGGAYPCKVKVRDVVRILKDDGWFLVRTRGSHQQYKHPTKLGLVTIAGNRNDELAPGTLNSILKQAGLKP